MRQDRETPGTGQDRTERDTIVSVADAAVLLGISTDAVRKRIRRGQMTARKVGAQWFVVLDELPVARQDRTGEPAVPRQDNPLSRPETGQDRAVSIEARSQLEAIRDEWLAPLVAQISEQAETIGYLRSGLDQAGLRLAEQADAVAQLTAEREQARLHAIAVEHEREHAQRQAEIAALEREQIEAERDALQARIAVLGSRMEILETTVAEFSVEAESAPQEAVAESPEEPENAAPAQPRRAWWQFWRT